MSDDDTLIIPPRFKSRDDPLLDMLVRAVFVLGMFMGALLLALGIAIGALL